MRIADCELRIGGADWVCDNTNCKCPVEPALEVQREEPRPWSPAPCWHKRSAAA